MVKANELLQDNAIQNPMAYAEFSALFFAMCEESRILCKSDLCPPSAKAVWFSLQVEISDSGNDIKNFLIQIYIRKYLKNIKSFKLYTYFKGSKIFKLNLRLLRTN